MNKQTHSRLLECLCCGSKQLQKILDLGNQPLANSYPKEQNAVEDRYPLQLFWCQDCTHLQLGVAVNPDLLFKNYLYVSGTTSTLRDYFTWFAEFAEGKIQSTNNKTVLDIACNDGSQLDAFKSRGWITWGIDPALNLAPLSSRNHNVIASYFTGEVEDQLPPEGFTCIVAQNVLAHNSYPKEFLRLCHKHLQPAGKIFIQTSQANMVEGGQFDTVYHEHISFFNVRSFAALLGGTGLYLEDVVKPSIHGTSYIFVVGTDASKNRAEELIAADYPVDSANINLFKGKVEAVVADLTAYVADSKDYYIVGYGAAAKGNTLLNYSGLKLDLVVDDNPLKHGLYTPGTGIPIAPPSAVSSLSGGKPVLWIPLSWNFFNEIVARVKSNYSGKQKFLRYFPSLEVVEE